MISEGTNVGGIEVEKLTLREQKTDNVRTTVVWLSPVIAPFTYSAECPSINTSIQYLFSASYHHASARIVGCDGCYFLMHILCQRDNGQSRRVTLSGSGEFGSWFRMMAMLKFEYTEYLLSVSVDCTQRNPAADTIITQRRKLVFLRIVSLGWLYRSVLSKIAVKYIYYSLRITQIPLTNWSTDWVSVSLTVVLLRLPGVTHSSVDGLFYLASCRSQICSWCAHETAALQSFDTASDWLTYAETLKGSLGAHTDILHFLPPAVTRTSKLADTQTHDKTLLRYSTSW